jgi:hypothetical protein
MTTWTPPRRFKAAKVVDAAAYNAQIVNNMKHLKDKQSQSWINSGGLITVTSTSFVPVTGATVSITVEKGQRLLLLVHCETAAVSGTAYFSVTFDGVNIGNATYGLYYVTSSAAVVKRAYPTLTYVTNQLEAGQHIATFICRVSAGNGYIYDGTSLTAMVMR